MDPIWWEELDAQERAELEAWFAEVNALDQSPGPAEEPEPVGSHDPAPF